MLIFSCLDLAKSMQGFFAGFPASAEETPAQTEVANAILKQNGKDDAANA